MTVGSIETVFTRRCGVELPIMCGGMHHVSFAPLVAAVSNAGALGCLTAITQPNPEALRNEIRKTRQLTKKPFGVNISFLPALKPPDYEGYVQCVVEEGIEVVETAGNNPGKWVQMLKDLAKKRGQKMTIIHKVVNLKHAAKAISLGVDILSMDGFECAGHPGSDDIGGLVLFALSAKKLNVPFIASGGFGDGRQMAAAFCLGAQGINMGTRFMATKEAPIHRNIKNALVEGKVTDTMMILRSLNNTERVYKNEMSEKAKKEEDAHPGDIEVIRKYIAGTLYKRSFQETGNIQDSVWSCGQVMGLIDDIPSCEELCQRVMNDCRNALNQANNIMSKL